VIPPSNVQRRMGLVSLPGNISVTSSMAGLSSSDTRALLAAKRKERLSSALLIAILAIVGLGTVITGWMLLHR
jgi:hypothetical protein